MADLELPAVDDRDGAARGVRDDCEAAEAVALDRPWAGKRRNAAYDLAGREVDDGDVSLGIRGDERVGRAASEPRECVPGTKEERRGGSGGDKLTAVHGSPTRRSARQVRQAVSATSAKRASTSSCSGPSTSISSRATARARSR